MTAADWDLEHRTAIAASHALADDNRRRIMLAARKREIAQNAADEAAA